ENQILDTADLAVLQIIDAAAEHLARSDLIRLDGIAGGGAIYRGVPFHVRVSLCTCQGHRSGKNRCECYRCWNFRHSSLLNSARVIALTVSARSQFRSVGHRFDQVKWSM